MSNSNPTAIALMSLHSGTHKCGTQWVRESWGPCEQYKMAAALQEEAEAQRGADARAALAVAWQAGYRAGCEDEKRDRGPVGGEGGPSTRNPYLTYDKWGRPSLRVDSDAILASIPEDDPGEDPWGGANLERS